jgi:uncharacterized protein with ParB-like and HNH nuclease domain
MAKFSEIPQLTSYGSYRVNISWVYLENCLTNWGETNPKVNLDPDFQREHVWTKTQQIAYVEYILRGGRSGREIYFNCPGWQRENHGEFVLVDGKQRINAVRLFMSNQLPIFNGNTFGDFTDKLRIADADFLFNVNNLETREQVLTWYLEMNSAGTPHTQEELNRVRNLLKTC